MSENTCPHCGKKDDFWFDRSILYDHFGNEVPEESGATRCTKCGKNVNLSKEYYEDLEQATRGTDANLHTTSLVVKIDQLKRVLRTVEHCVVSEEGDDMCPLCGVGAPEHNPNCIIYKALIDGCDATRREGRR